MNQWNEKKETELDRFLERHNPEAPPARLGELNRIKAHLDAPAPQRPGWLVWSPALGTIAAMLWVWVAVYKAPVRSMEDEGALDSVETASLLDEEPGADWNLILSSVE